MLMDILYLTLKKKWFDMILSGEKTEEYREIKEYWEKRLSVWDDNIFLMHKEFDAVEFRNGYQKDAPKFLIECRRILIDYGLTTWGAPPNKVYVIQLGKILKTPLDYETNDSI